MLPTLYLTNTKTRKKELFVPLRPDQVTLYVCGPTVYDVAHIGNARSAVVFDVLFRMLRWQYRDVVYARNITDIDDKIITAATERREDIAKITHRYTSAYQEDMAALGCLNPTIEPKATETIPAMLSLIDALLLRGHAYIADRHVLFDVTSFNDYGGLSHRGEAECQAGARVEIATYKRHPEDFVLWKPSSAEQPGFESPYGFGRPGWHLECSAMINQHLGETIDIHGGGNDLVFPHHENERAQSVCGYGGDFVRFWLHNGFVTVGGEKMSKSLGNWQSVQELRQRYRPEAMRWLMLSAQYRQPLDWTHEGLTQAKANLDRLYKVLLEVESEPVTLLHDDGVALALCDDLNTPLAFARLFELAGDFFKSSKHAVRLDIKARLLGAGDMLGFFSAQPKAWFQGDSVDAAAIEAKIAARLAARKAKNFAGADAIRAELLQQGIVLEDTPQGTTWRRA